MNPERKEKWKRILSMHQRGVRNSEIIRRLGVKNEHVNFVVRMYEMYGAKCYYMMHASHNPEIKREVLAECHENVLSLWDISLRHCVEPLVIRGWLKAEKSGMGSVRRHKSGDMKKTTEEKPLVFKNDKEKIEYLEAENAYLKKSIRLGYKECRKELGNGGKAEIVCELRRDGHRLKWLLASSNLKRATYYACLRRLETKTDKYAGEKSSIRRIFDKSRGRYGYRRVWLSLRNEGAVISARTVLRLMQEMGVQGKRRRTGNHSYKRGVEGAARNIIDRNFKAERPDEKFATDISMIKIHGKYRYLSAIIDMFNGEVRGYAISAHPDIVLVRRTLDRFMESAGRHVSGSILHSDQGCQYNSSEYVNTLAARGIIQSMSRKGNCLDNAMMENFFALMKVELLYSRDWDDMNQFVTSLHSYIRWYNMDRLKLRLNGLTPYQARQEYYRKTIRKNV